MANGTDWRQDECVSFVGVEPLGSSWETDVTDRDERIPAICLPLPFRCISSASRGSLAVARQPRQPLLHLPQPVPGSWPPAGPPRRRRSSSQGTHRQAGWLRLAGGLSWLKQWRLGVADRRKSPESRDQPSLKLPCASLEGWRPARLSLPESYNKLGAVWDAPCSVSSWSVACA